MEIKIDLDMNQIDYDAINKQIQEKIADIDLKEMYQIDSKINYQIKEQVDDEIRTHLKYGSWGGLNENSKREIKDEISKNIIELIKPHVENIFNQIPKEELHGIISDLIPKVLMDLLSSHMRDLVSGYYYSSEANTMRICEERIQSILR